MKTKNSRRSSLAPIILPARNFPLLLTPSKRVPVDIAHSPIQDARIRARAPDQLRRSIGPVLVGFGDSETVAGAYDRRGPVAAAGDEFVGPGHGAGAVDVDDEERVRAPVPDFLGGEGGG
jgi:hypothetical protein